MFSDQFSRKISAVNAILKRVNNPEDGEFVFSKIAREGSSEREYSNRRVIALIAQYNKEGEKPRYQLVIETTAGESPPDFAIKAEGLIRQFITDMTADRPVIKPAEVDTYEIFNHPTDRDTALGIGLRHFASEAPDDGDLDALVKHNLTHATVLFRYTAGALSKEHELKLSSRRSDRMALGAVALDFPKLKLK